MGSFGGHDHHELWRPKTTQQTSEICSIKKQAPNKQYADIIVIQYCWGCCTIEKDV